MPTPRPDRTLRGDHDTRFWMHCSKGELAIQHCDKCQTYFWPPVEACGSCGAADMPVRMMSGRGKVRSYCTFERQYYPEYPPPWTTVLIELDEGPLFISNTPGIASDDLKDGMALTVEFLDAEDKHGPFSLPVFRAG
jgi:uncharacterized OB-fold protein